MFPLSSPTNNQVLTYNTNAGKWVNQSSAGGVSLDGTSSDIQPLGAQAAGATGKAADAGHVHAMPRLDQVGSPTSSVSLNSQKITGLANGANPQDAVAPVLSGKITTQSTLPTSVTSSGWTTSSNMYLGLITP
jgi:hypothetical protein